MVDDTIPVRPGEELNIGALEGFLEKMYWTFQMNRWNYNNFLWAIPI